jgi:hypothetical protein
MVDHTITIDDEVLRELGQRARPFIDTKPNDVIRALLGLEGATKSQSDARGSLVPLSSPRARRKAQSSKSASTTRTRVRKGSLLDERAYEIPILRALEERGGRAAAREVVDRVGELVDDHLTPLDREMVETGGIRWQARVQFARLRMKEQGQLKPDSPRGVWEITDEGRERLRREDATAA